MVVLVGDLTGIMSKTWIKIVSPARIGYGTGGSDVKWQSALGGPPALQL